MFRQSGGSRLIHSFVAGAILVCVAHTAHAIPVSVTGGFTSFSGVVGAGGTFVTAINGSVVCPDSGCSTVSGNTSFAFASPTSTVDTTFLGTGSKTVVVNEGEIRNDDVHDNSPRTGERPVGAVIPSPAAIHRDFQ